MACNYYAEERHAVTKFFGKGSVKQFLRIVKCGLDKKIKVKCGKWHTFKHCCNISDNHILNQMSLKALEDDLKLVESSSTPKSMRYFP